jgi:hypothetical protein
VNTEDYKVVVEGPQLPKVVSMRIKEGTFKFSYEPKISGDYFISLHLNGSSLLEKHQVHWTPALAVFDKSNSGTLERDDILFSEPEETSKISIYATPAVDDIPQLTVGVPETTETSQQFGVNFF